MGERLIFVAFDFDGTLIDSARAIVEGVRACWEACGWPEPDADAVRRVIGLPWEEGAKLLIPGAGPAEVARIRGYYDDVAAGRRTRPVTAESLFPGAVEALDALAAEGALLGIVTSRNLRTLIAHLERHGIRERFVTMKTVDHGPGKPSPYLLHEAMAEAGAAAGDTVMVGDTVFDVQMARNAGTLALGVGWGVHDADELAAAGAHRVVSGFHEVPPSIALLLGGG